MMLFYFHLSLFWLKIVHQVSIRDSMKCGGEKKALFSNLHGICLMLILINMELVLNRTPNVGVALIIT